jgi:serine/threonine-protein kinase
VEDAAPPSAEARLGTTLRGKWRLDSILGKGGMGVVYAATHRNGKRVAIKMLLPELSENSAAIKRFLREAYVANRIGHPGAVSVLDDDTTEDGAAFLVMDLLEGKTGLEWLRSQERPMGEREALRIADELLDVLAAAHEKGIIHRDIKPENIFLTKAGPTKVLDFGLARDLIPPSGSSRVSSSSLTMGTPAFMPPEQARGESSQVDARSDLWSLGATLFTLLTGQWVHEAARKEGLLVAAMSKPAPPIQSVLPGLSHEVAVVIDKALSFDKKERWPSARTMQIAVRNAASVVQARRRRSGSHAEPSGPSVPPATSPPSRPSSSPSPAWLARLPRGTSALLGLFSIALVAALLVAFLPRTSPADPPPATPGAPGQPETMILRIAAHPPEAEVFLDEARLPQNPYVGIHPLDRSQHSLRIMARGFAPVAKVFSFDHDLTFDVELAPVPAPSASDDPRRPPHP